MKRTSLKLLTFIALIAISTNGYSQLKNPMKEKQQKEEAARKAAAEKRAATLRYQREKERIKQEEADRYKREQERIRQEEADRYKREQERIRQEEVDRYKREQERIKQETEGVLSIVNSFKMVYIVGGTFTMGKTNGYIFEKPKHHVTVSSFYMGSTEVTQALWKAVMGSNPSSFEGENRPVERVSWDDCQTFILKLNQLTGKSYRLPTEAEWEFAARGGEDLRTKRASANNESSLGDYAWYSDNSGGTTHAVGTKSPNRLGLYDMSGNVREWCSDWFGYFSSISQINPTGPLSGSERVCRGGGWDSFESDCAPTYRYYCYRTDFHWHDLGLRLVSPK